MGLSSIFVRNSAFFLYVIAKWSDDSARDKGRRAFALRPNRLFRLFRDGAVFEVRVAVGVTGEALHALGDQRRRDVVVNRHDRALLRQQRLGFLIQFLALLVGDAAAHLVAKLEVGRAIPAGLGLAFGVLQHGERGERALWQHILRVSVEDLKRNYDNLGVSFDVWLGESDAQKYIPQMLETVKAKGLCVESEGALVVPVQEETDAKEVPPCILVKSDGATLYATTDLATIVQREQDYHPQKYMYLTDKRQNLHFEQVFRVAKKAGLVSADTQLGHIGFGTMNGKDGKPFKTRAGGVMRLETLIADVTDYVTSKIKENQTVSDEELPQTAKCIAMAALKYGDLSNLPTKDYVFDLDRFSSFEGNTGPYILYTIVRIKSILAKYGKPVSGAQLLPPESAEQKQLMLVLSRMADALWTAYRDSAPNAVCAYIYELATAANKFYHDVKILTEPDEKKQASYAALIDLTRGVLETCIDLLGFSAPERM